MKKANSGTSGASSKLFGSPLSQATAIHRAWLAQWVFSTVAGVAIFLVLAFVTGSSAGRYYRGPAPDPPLENLILVLVIAAASFVIPMLSATEPLREHGIDRGGMLLATAGLIGISLVLAIVNCLYIDYGPWEAGTIGVTALSVCGSSLAVFCFFLPHLILSFLQRSRVTKSAGGTAATRVGYT
jgi:FtsH-binding integral membrane protein